jgi:hypothetical protein
MHLIRACIQRMGARIHFIHARIQRMGACVRANASRLPDIRALFCSTRASMAEMVTSPSAVRTAIVSFPEGMSPTASRVACENADGLAKGLRATPDRSPIG